ncbi:MAG TPA: tetratricopeptide repeat protein [Bryobacteraceae bacterium]|nr:tetratricopeptide repeat protein [Bryobacteraceae bacterium]
MRWLWPILLLPGSLSGANLDELLAAYRANPSDWKIAHQTALAYTERNQYTQAAGFYRKALAGNPGFLPARKNLAVVLWFAGRRSEAEAIFRQLLPQIPRDPVPRLYIGLAAHGRAQHKDAHDQFAAAGDLALSNPDVLPEVVESYLAVQDNSVLAHAAKLLGSARDGQLSLRTAAVLDRYGAVEAAYSAYRQALEYAPSWEPTYIAFAAFASAHQNNRYAVEIIDRGLKQLPASAALRFQRGLLIAMEGDREAAAQEFRAASKADPGWSLPVLAAGVLELEDGRAAEAAETFGRVLQDHPDDRYAPYLRALALSRGGDEFTRPEQIALLERAVRVNPTDARARTLLGQSYVSAGRAAEGLTQLKRAVSIDERNPTAHYQLSLALRRAGRVAQADRHLARFRELRAAAAKQQETELVQFLKVER